MCTENIAALEFILAIFQVILLHIIPSVRSQRSDWMQQAVLKACASSACMNRRPIHSIRAVQGTPRTSGCEPLTRVRLDCSCLLAWWLQERNDGTIQLRL